MASEFYHEFVFLLATNVFIDINNTQKHLKYYNDLNNYVLHHTYYVFREVNPYLICCLVAA